MEKRLYRDELNKKIAGVCAGLAEYLSVDVTVVRVIFVLALVLKGVGFLPYIVLWIVLPKKPYNLYNNPNVDYTVPPQNDSFNPFSAGVPPQAPFAVTPKKRSNAGLIAGIVLVVLGAFFLLDEFNVFPSLDLEQLWPVILIVIGLVVIFSGKENKPDFTHQGWQAADKKDEAKPANETATDNPTNEQ